MVTIKKGQYPHPFDALWTNRTTRTAVKVALIVGAVALTTGYGSGVYPVYPPASGAGGSGGSTSGTTGTPTPACDLPQAGEFAIQANLQLINGASVNPGRYFTPGGSDSCISGVMLQSFDLSNLIPDFWGMVSSALENAIVSGVSSAIRNVCNSVNGAIQNTVGNINNAITTVNNGIPLGYGFLNFNQVNPNFAGTLNGNGSFGIQGNGSNNAFGIIGPVNTNGTSGNTGGLPGGGATPAPTGGGSTGGGSGGFVTGAPQARSAPAAASTYNTYNPPPAVAPSAGGYAPSPAPADDSRARSSSGDSGFWGRIFGQ